MASNVSSAKFAEVSITIDQESSRRVMLLLESVSLAYGYSSSVRSWLIERADPYFRSRFRDNFDSQGRVYGAWAPLSPTTLEWRRKQKYAANSASTLKARGTLRDWLISSPGLVDDAAEALIYPNFGRASAKTKQKFSSHQEGFTSSLWGKGKKEVPARKMVGVTGEDNDRLSQLLHQWIIEKIRSRGR